MVVAPSCRALLVYDDDDFRKRLIRKLDEKHFSVSFSTDGDVARGLLSEREYHVVLVGVDLNTKKGVTFLDHLRDHRDKMRCGVIVIGDPDPALRTFAPWVDETLMKPVDPDYVARRAQTYCKC